MLTSWLQQEELLVLPKVDIVNIDQLIFNYSSANIVTGLVGESQSIKRQKEPTSAGCV